MKTVLGDALFKPTKPIARRMVALKVAKWSALLMLITGVALIGVMLLLPDTVMVGTTGVKVMMTVHSELISDVR